MLIDGEKWACEACVRGHRVSSCRHNDRPLIRINKKGRPFSVCCLCRGPCKEQEEHSKLNRSKKSDGESNAKSSGKKTAERRRVKPASFARIAPQPAPLPSPPGQHPAISGPVRSASMATSPTGAIGFAPSSQFPNPGLGPVPAPIETYPQMGYPLAPPTSLGQIPVPQPAYQYQFSGDNFFPEDASFTDHGMLEDPDLSGLFQDLDDLPEDWSAYFLPT